MLVIWPQMHQHQWCVFLVVSWPFLWSNDTKPLGALHYSPITRLFSPCMQACNPLTIHRLCFGTSKLINLQEKRGNSENMHRDVMCKIRLVLMEMLEMLSRLVDSRRIWSVRCEQQRPNCSALDRDFLDDSTCRIGGDSSVRENLLIGCSGKVPAHAKRHGNSEWQPPE